MIYDSYNSSISNLSYKNGTKCYCLTKNIQKGKKNCIVNEKILNSSISTESAVKILLQAYYKLEKLAYKGNTSAHAVVLDLRQALERVPSKQREALIIVYVNGIDYRDAALDLMIKPGSVGDRLANGIRSLAKILNSDDLWTDAIKN